MNPTALSCPPIRKTLPASHSSSTFFACRVLKSGRAKAPLKLSDGDYPAGSLIVKTNQPYGPLARTLLGKQTDPDPELTTYDDSAWTMSLMTNTVIKPTKDIAVQSVAVDPWISTSRKAR